MMKVLFAMAQPQATGFVESRLGLIGLDEDVTDFSTLSLSHKTLAREHPASGRAGLAASLDRYRAGKRHWFERTSVEDRGRRGMECPQARQALES
jgi:hypothetical protein